MKFLLGKNNFFKARIPFEKGSTKSWNSIGKIIFDMTFWFKKEGSKCPKWKSFLICLQHLNIAFSFVTFIVFLPFYQNLFLCFPVPVKYLLSLSFSKVLTFACCFTSLYSPHFSMQFFSFSCVLSMYISILSLPTYFYFLTGTSPSLHFFNQIFAFSLL